MQLSAIDNTGKPVDWWFMYKVAGRAHGNVKGIEYLYYDANDEKNKAHLKYTSYDVSKNGALFNTLNQIYTAGNNPKMGWWFYNDENPITNEISSERGHTKGVLAFDLETNTAFWIILSVPLFPTPKTYTYPQTGIDMAQTILCITLKDADVAKSLANQMYMAQHPNVYHASSIPQGMDPKDPRALIISNQVDSSKTAYTHILPFLSKGGKKFTCIAKNRYYNDCFYSDLVGPALAADLDVETWQDSEVLKGPDGKIQYHNIAAMKSVVLDPLQVQVEWDEGVDHAKLAVSQQEEANHFICVGDLNFTKPQEKRSGGTVAFQSELLWEDILKILKETKLAPAPKTNKKVA